MGMQQLLLTSRSLLFLCLRSVDLGLYFAEEEEEQLAQEDKALSLLVMSTDQDDTFDPVDTEDLLAQMSSGRRRFSIGLIKHQQQQQQRQQITARP